MVAIVAMLGLAGGAGAQQVVDRIAVRIENDILTESEFQELEKFQNLWRRKGRVAGAGAGASTTSAQGAKREELLRQLVEQWIVEREAEAGRFRGPTAQEIQQEMQRLEAETGGAEAFEARLRELGMNRGGVARLLEKMLRLTRYLDHKFRPAAQVEAAQIETFYREEWAPGARARGITAPALEAVQEQLREILIEREITARAGRWLEETRSQLRIEIAGKEAVKK